MTQEQIHSPNIITPEPSDGILLQSLSMCMLLEGLDRDKFLLTPYFQNLQFYNNEYKKILIDSGLGNPAAMLTALYLMLIVPKESSILSSANIYNLNQQIYQIVEPETKSTYPNENTLDKIDYIRHIRNALAHSRFKFNTENNKNLIIFMDEQPGKKNKPNKKCIIKAECGQLALIFDYLLKCAEKYIIKKYYS